MSGRSEARFPVADGRRLREEAVARRIERLFAVELVVAPPPAAGPRQEQAAGCWVTLRGSAGETERAKVTRSCSIRLYMYVLHVVCIERCM